MFSSCSGNIVIRFLRLGGIKGTELGPELCMCERWEGRGGGGEDLVLCLYDCRSQCGYQCCSQTISAYTVLRGWPGTRLCGYLPL